jgi:hypothetical protein
MCTRAFRCRRQSSVPLVHKHAKFLAQGEQFLDASSQSFESLTDDSPNTQARSIASVADCQDAFEVRKRKSYDQCPLNEQHAFDVGGRVQSIPGR